VGRAEFLNSLGPVNDYLDVLAAVQSPEQEVRIKQGVGKELRDLVAKYALADLTHLVRSDEAIRLALTATMNRIASLTIVPTSRLCCDMY